MKKRLVIILFFILIFIGFIINWNISYFKGLEEASIPLEATETGHLIPTERKVFDRANFSMEYANMPVEKRHQRSLKEYYDNRPFSGAPPSIPHPVVQDRTMGGNACLQCHQNGGFVAKFDAYAPITPHPEMLNCRQCHNPKRTNTLFQASNFKTPKPFRVGEETSNVLSGMPTPIPHSLQLRENCVACHAGPAAVKEIRTDHADRVNCRQCHVAIQRDRNPMEVEIFPKTSSVNE